MVINGPTVNIHTMHIITSSMYDCVHVIISLVLCNYSTFSVHEPLATTYSINDYSINYKYITMYTQTSIIITHTQSHTNCFIADLQYILIQLI